MLENLYIYYTGDLHSDFTYLPQTHSYLNDKRRRRAEEGASFWTVDIGDHIDRVDPIAEAFMGKANINLLNDAKYDVVTIGNNEGITFSHEELFHLYDEADFPVVCANLQNAQGSNPTWLHPSITLQAKSGIKVAYIGLTAPFKPFYSRLFWDADSAEATLRKHLENVKKEADIIILLSHLGYDDDVLLAKQFPDIDVIIGGHTHHLLRQGEQIEESLLTAKGKGGGNVGEVILTWDHERNKLVNKQAYVKDITHLEKDRKTVQRLTEFTEEAERILSETVVTVEENLSVHWFKTTKIIEQLTDVLKDWTKADLAMLNAGLLLEAFQAGKITYGDIHRICPHPINPCVVEVTGGTLLEILRVAETRKVKQLRLEGYGFRGEVIGKMIFSGIEIERSNDTSADSLIKGASIQGKPVQLNQTYKLATADTFTFGSIITGIAKAPVKNYFLPEFLRDVLVYTLKKNYSNSNRKDEIKAKE